MKKGLNRTATVDLCRKSNALPTDFPPRCPPSIFSSHIYKRASIVWKWLLRPYVTSCVGHWELSVTNVAWHSSLSLCATFPPAVAPCHLSPATLQQSRTFSAGNVNYVYMLSLRLFWCVKKIPTQSHLKITIPSNKKRKEKKQQPNRKWTLCLYFNLYVNGIPVLAGDKVCKAKSHQEMY